MVTLRHPYSRDVPEPHGCMKVIDHAIEIGKDDEFSFYNELFHI